MNQNKNTTEGRNKKTINIDNVSTTEMVKLINYQDKIVAFAVETAINEIAKAIDEGYKCVKKGGRIIYFGAGTSGRIGILDASEIFPTFGAKDLFIGLIAGGDKAIRHPVEAAEDDEKSVLDDLKSINASENDLFVGIAASGRTPYVISGIKYGNKIGAQTVSISTSQNAIISSLANISIEAITGAEPITGSTRMKSGTAQKMILNQISTGIMIKLGKIYSNLMVDMIASNEKLVNRGIKMVMEVAQVDIKTAKKAYISSNQNVKVAVVMLKKSMSKEEAIVALKNQDDMLREVI